MDVERLYLTISQALQEEQTSGSLASYLERRQPFLHRSIELEQGEAGQQLLAFVRAYVGQVPPLLVQAWQPCQGQAYRWLRRALMTARRLFLGRCNGVLTLSGLLIRAYLAHRLIEEINDRFIQQVGYSLLDPDITRANLVAYELIGATQANRLDSAVLVLVAQLAEDVAEQWPLCEEHSNVRPLEIWRQRDCLSQQVGVKLTWRVA